MFNPDDPDPDYELVWPRELLRSEAAALGQRMLEADYVADVEMLVEEAFAGRRPVEDLREVVRDPAGNFSVHPSSFLDELVGEHLEELAQHIPPHPYWSARHGRGLAAAPGATEPMLDRQLRLQHDWIGLIEDLRARGYLDRTAPRGCRADGAHDQDAVLDRETADRIGVEGLWPPRVEAMTSPADTDRFFDLVEVLHDLVARPRHRSWHQSPGCGWHYSRFAAAPGRALYRWQVDRVLARHGVDLRMAAAGEDTGRLIQVAGDGRDELAVRVVTVEAAQGTRQHAVASFRGRGADREMKRSAVVALAALLEERRDLLRAELLRPDEGALFEIANRFELRHRRADQRGDYDEAYLDWLYWWYLATLDLTDTLLGRQDDRSTP